MKKPWTVLIAIALAIFVGTIINKESWLYPVFDVIGTLFIQALTLVVVPLVMASIITGVARIANEKQFGKLGIKIFGFFILTNLIGILIGVGIGDIAQPGAGAQLPMNLAQTAKITNNGTIANLLLEIIPSNILDALTKGKMLGLIFFSILFGYALTNIPKKAFQAHKRIWQGVFEAMIKITHGIMYFLPFGVFCLVAKIFADLGLETLRPLGNLIWASILGLALFAFGAIPLLLKIIGRVNFRQYFRAVSPALITAFSTSSSAATLPISLECMEERAGINSDHTVDLFERVRVNRLILCLLILQPIYPLTL